MVISAAPQLPLEEVRLGVVLNGGVSLAVWMGGATKEIDRLVKASPRRGSSDSGPGDDGVCLPYRLMLTLAGCTARVDIIAGTSAGGINGAALALAQANAAADVGGLREVWIAQGRIEGLLRKPFSGQPNSLLKGDDFFLPELAHAMRALATPYRLPAQPHPIDLSVMTTVLAGNQIVTVDSLGQQIPDQLHGGRFHWAGEPGSGKHPNAFDESVLVATAAQLALAARSSASFPVAFEPSFIPVDEGEREASTSSPKVDDPYRPDMATVVQEWGDPSGLDRSRFVVDGGLLANTPTLPVLRAIAEMPAGAPVRRVMLLVHPHAGLPTVQEPDDRHAAPSLAATINGIVGVLTAQGSRAFLEEIREHNVAATGRRGTRSELLQTLDAGGLARLASALYPHYVELRIRRAARDLADRVQALPGEQQPRGLDHWTFDRLRASAEAAQRRWITQHTTGLPYAPAPPLDLAVAETEDQWRWGVSGALDVAEVVNDLLRVLVRVLPAGEPYNEVAAARTVVTRALATLSASRGGTDAIWAENDELRRLAPTESYWALRLLYYDLRMGRLRTREEASALLEVAVQAAYQASSDAGIVVGTEVFEAIEEDTRLVPLAERRRFMILEQLADAAAEASDHPGRIARSEVDIVVSALLRAWPHLRAFVEGGTEPTGPEDRQFLTNWHSLFAAKDEKEQAAKLTSQRLLSTLLRLEVVATCLSDERSTEAAQPVELVQLSARVEHPFMRHTRTPDDKLGGMSVARFGGFLKSSWRVNDWMWGRLDAATVLARTILDPARVRRAAVLSGEDFSEPEVLATGKVDELVTTLYGSSDGLDGPVFEEIRSTAIAELTRVYNTAAIPAGALDASMPGLAALFAWRVHLDAVTEDLPALARSIKTDRVEGANARSRGELLLVQESALFDRLEDVDPATPPDLPVKVRALTAFDAAGIGREPLAEEMRSDLMIRTTAAAAAVATTVLDSKGLGVPAVKPFTKTLRGGMLVAFWGIVGLTTRSVTARSMALLGLAIGGVLGLTALFGALPPSWSGPAALIGASAITAVFAFGALRTGTLLHGLVLLSPILPLLVYAFDRARTSSSEGSTEAVSGLRAGVTLTAVVLAVVALLILGALPATYSSPWLAVGKLADRMGFPSRGEGELSWSRELAWGAWRRLRGTVRALRGALVPLLVVAVVVAMAWYLAMHVEKVRTFIGQQSDALLVGSAVAVVLGLCIVFPAGYYLRPVTRTADRNHPDSPAWIYGPLGDTWTIHASWSVLHGGGYLVVAAILRHSLWSDWKGERWFIAAMVTCYLLGLILCVLIPVIAPLRALHRLDREERERGAPAPGGPPLAERLSERRLGYRYLVSIRPGADGVQPSLTRAGAALEKRLAETSPSGPRTWLSGRRWLWHVLPDAIGPAVVVGAVAGLVWWVATRSPSDIHRWHTDDLGRSVLLLIGVLLLAALFSTAARRVGVRSDLTSSRGTVVPAVLLVAVVVGAAWWLARGNGLPLHVLLGAECVIALRLLTQPWLRQGFAWGELERSALDASRVTVGGATQAAWGADGLLKHLTNASRKGKSFSRAVLRGEGEKESLGRLGRELLRRLHDPPPGFSDARLRWRLRRWKGWFGL